jgi:hypothetical protein
MIHELRTYTIKMGGGGVRELERRFGLSMEVRQKYSRLGGFFHTEIGRTSQVVHIWPYEGLKERADTRSASTKDDSGRWPPGIGELFEMQEVEILLPAPFMRQLEPQQLGRIWELSWLDYPPSSVDGALEAYERALPHREEYYPVVGCWTVDAGASIGRIYLLAPFKDWGHRDEVTAKLREDEAWPPRPAIPAVGGGSKILLPSAFSPLH